MKRINIITFVIISLLCIGCSDSTIDNMYTLSMTDRPATFSLSVDKTSFSTGFNQFSSTVNIEGTDDWELATNDDWISLNITSGIGNGSFTFNVKPNPSSQSRSGSISVKGKKSGKTLNVSISQSGDNTPYLTFAAKNEQKVQMSVAINTMEYTVNGCDWSPLETNVITFGGNKGDIRLRGKSQMGTTSNIYNEYSYFIFDNNEPVEANGDIRTIIDYQNYESANTKSARFCYLFQYCSALIKAPELPATELADYCYFGMFTCCSSLIKAPKLPATTLADDCYEKMFEGCTALTDAPELPATKMAKNCYAVMFTDCRSLTQAPELPSTELANGCYAAMFQGCYALTSAPELPANILSEGCYQWMFCRCKSLINAPAILPAVQLKDYCYAEMFEGCSLINAPELPAKFTAKSCYYNMFAGCTSLQYIKMMAIDIDEAFKNPWSDYDTNIYFCSTETSGKFIKNNCAVWKESDVIPSGWTVIEEEDPDNILSGLKPDYSYGVSTIYNSSVEYDTEDVNKYIKIINNNSYQCYTIEDVDVDYFSTILKFPLINTNDNRFYFVAKIRQKNLTNRNYRLSIYDFTDNQFHIIKEIDNLKFEDGFFGDGIQTLLFPVDIANFGIINNLNINFQLYDIKQYFVGQREFEIINLGLIPY